MPDMRMLVFAPLVLGLALLVTGIVLRIRDGRLYRHGRKVDGAVVGFETHSSGDGYTEHPIIAFVTETGDEVCEEMAYGIDLGGFQPGRGRTVPVWYDPDDPTRFVAHAAGRGCVWVVLVVLGGGITALAAAFALALFGG